MTPGSAHLTRHADGSISVAFTPADATHLECAREVVEALAAAEAERSEWQDEATRAWRERDEALAEVERLRAVVNAAARIVDIWHARAEKAEAALDRVEALHEGPDPDDDGDDVLVTWASVRAALRDDA